MPDVEIDSLTEDERIDSNRKMLSARIKALNNCFSGKEVTTPEPEKIAQYKKGNPFDVVKKTEAGLLTVNFSVLDDCCQRHLAKPARINSDTLLLDFRLLPSDEVCECICEYKYEMKVGLEDYKFDKYFLDKKEI